MIGKQERWQEDLFVAGPLSSLIPDDHILKRVDAILDLSWLSELVKDTYCSDNGRRSIDPESALRLMLAGFFEGIIHDRKLMRTAQVNLAIRWFAGYQLHESLPDLHLPLLPNNRQFRKIEQIHFPIRIPVRPVTPIIRRPAILP